RQKKRLLQATKKLQSNRVPVTNRRSKSRVVGMAAVLAGVEVEAVFLNQSLFRNVAHRKLPKPRRVLPMSLLCCPASRSPSTARQWNKAHQRKRPPKNHLFRLSAKSPHLGNRRQLQLWSLSGSLLKLPVGMVA